MYPHLIPTIEALGVEPNDTNINILQRAFNRVKSDDCVYKLREFAADNGHTRFIGLDSQGQSVVLVGEKMPEIGSLMFTGGKNYYVESYLETESEIAAALARNNDPARRTEQANKSGKAST